MREAGCSKLIFSSTGAVYGNATPEPIREDAQCQPINPYGKSKWMIERILTDFRQAYQLNFFCFSCFNGGGADPSGLIGELRDTETHLIPRALMALQGRCGDVRADCLKARAKCVTERPHSSASRFSEISEPRLAVISSLTEPSGDVRSGRFVLRGRVGDRDSARGEVVPCKATS